jgi:type VII secretion protein EccE
MRHRRWHRIGPVRVEQLVVVELILLGLLALLRQPWWQLAAGGAAGLLVLLVMFAGSGGSWWLERLALRFRYRARRAASRPGRGTDQRLAALRELSPALSVTTAEERGGRIGVGHDGLGWFATAEVRGHTGVIEGGAEPLALGALARTLLEDEFPVSAIQVVTHTVPAPASMLAAEAPCQTSYRELLGAVGGGSVVHQAQWVTVRLDGEDAADAAELRGGGTVGVHRAMAAALARVTTAVAGVDRDARALDADELLDALVRSCGVIGAGNNSGGPRTAEEWERWRGDGLTHVAYWIRDWPSVHAEQGGLLADLVADCGVETSLSVLLRKPLLAADQETESAVDLQCVVRVMSEPEALRWACGGFVQAAERIGFGLRLLSGEQAPAVYASAPTGVPR